MAKDIAETLGYRMASDMTRRLDDDEKGVSITYTPGGTQKITVINESGLYTAVLRKDVCRVLELNNPTEALRGLNEDERRLP